MTASFLPGKGRICSLPQLLQAVYFIWRQGRCPFLVNDTTTRGNIVNIFATSDCPLESARYLDDKRVVKMVLESAQLLSTAMTLTGGHGPYRVTHANHPCSVWTRTSKDNYQWLLDHFVALCDEYEARYQRLHSCEELLPLLQDGIDLMPGKGQTPFMNCTPHKELPVHEAYLLTLTEKWQQDKRAPTRYGLPLI